VKFLNFLISGANLLLQLKTMIQRIFLCIPMILKLIPIMLMVFYLYAIIGMQLFNISTHPYREGSPYEMPFSDMSTFLGALKLLFQVSIEAK
jgi:hypothetical protein